MTGQGHRGRAEAAGQMRDNVAMVSTTIVQGAEVTDFPTLTPQAARGRVLRVTEVGEDVLHRPCRQVTEFGTEELRTLVDDMFATMLIAEGVGLAANQVDV